MKTYNCIIIEDEPLSAEILQDYIRDIPFLLLKNTYASATTALEHLHKEHVDLMFLDINLPRLKGIDFLKTLKNPPHVIITSAYQEYALQGYELNVVDYLLKPIEFSRFVTAVNKLKFITSQQAYNNSVFMPQGKEFLFVHVGKKRVKILLKDILYIESQKEYVRIVTTKESILTRSQLGQIEEQLDKAEFLRIHRSFLIARNKINAYTNTTIELHGKILPIGRSYKELVIGILDEPA